MATKLSNPAPASRRKKMEEPLKLIYLFFLIGYGFVTVLTPNLQALDSNGPKFLSLALLNLATFLFLFTRREFKYRSEWYLAFFKNGIGIAYTGLMVVSLLSFFKAINVLESVLHFSKIFTTFSAAYLVSVLILADRRNIQYLCVAMTFLLIVDSLYVFSGIKEFIAGKVGDIDQLKSGYSNKNILASSIFVKLPFAIWLMVFSRRWLRATGLLGTFFAITATLFMSTRAFYLGTIVLSMLLFLFFYLRFRQSRDMAQIKIAGIYLVLVLGSFLTYSATQRYLYSSKGSGYAVSVKERLSTIAVSESSGNARLNGWVRSLHVFKENPLLGVGLGNWKIATLKEENLSINDDSVVLYKAHNDFIETTTETGIFGGLLFMAIFILTGWIFLRILIRKASSEWVILLFLPTFGLFCYSVDAFFNSPQDRPEIGALFALYFGMAVALRTLIADELKSESRKNPEGKFPFRQGFQPFAQLLFFSEQFIETNLRFFRLPLLMMCGMMLFVSTYILILNFKSLKMQYLVEADIKLGKLTHPASLFLNGFPAIPDLNNFIVPIDADKARYLINENRNDEAIVLLKKNKSNPYDDMVPAFISLAYRNQNKIDSFQTYVQKAYTIRPNKFKNIFNLCSALDQKGLVKEVEVILDNYLDNNKNNKKGWLLSFEFFNRTGNFQKAIAVIDSAIHYFPGDSLVLKQKKIMDLKKIILPYQKQYNSGMEAFKAKKYNEAVGYFNEILDKEPGFTEVRGYRAFSLQFIKEFTKSNLDLDFLLPIREPWTFSYNPYTLRGANYWNLGNKENACRNFKIAAEMGDKEGIDNYTKLCK